MRSDADLRQEDLGRRMGWSREIVSNIEQGRRGVTVDEFIVLAEQVHEDPVTLFQGILERGRKRSGRH
jgi:transcriptional regulator with XRE-family HTH domain